MDVSALGEDDAQSSKQTTLPAAFWGLDAVFRAHHKLFIVDVVALPQAPFIPGVFNYGGRPISKVDVLGLVVAVTHRERFSLYAVDDGTAVINCKCWKNSHENVTGQNEVELGSDLYMLLERRLPMGEVQHNLGDLLHVRGAIKEYRGQREIAAYYHVSIDDRMQEALRMTTLPELYRAVYDQPPKLPHGVISQNTGKKIETEETEVDALERLQREHKLQQIILSHLADSRVEILKLAQLQKENSIQKFLTSEGILESAATTLLSAVVERLVVQGYLFSDHAKNFMVSGSHSGLHQAVLKVLRDDASKPRYAETGCHYEQLLKKVRTHVQYSQLSRPALLNCLHVLEGRSEIISVTDSHYLFMDLG